MGLFKKLRKFARHVVPIVRTAMPIVEVIAQLFGPEGEAIAAGLKVMIYLLGRFAASE